MPSRIIAISLRDNPRARLIFASFIAGLASWLIFSPFQNCGGAEKSFLLLPLACAGAAFVASLKLPETLLANGLAAALVIGVAAGLDMTDWNEGGLRGSGGGHCETLTGLGGFLAYVIYAGGSSLLTGLAPALLLRWGLQKLLRWGLQKREPTR
jgi:hypothetical protein